MATNDIRQFVMFGSHRTGSTLLVHLLNKIESITCYEEIFNVKCYNETKPVNVNPKRKDGKIQSCSLEKEKNSKPLAYWNEIVSLSDESTKAVGFKIFSNQNDEFIKFTAESSEFEKIILSRNPIAKYISFLRANESTGKWYQHCYDPDLNKKDLIFNPDKFELYLKNHNYYFTWYLKLAKKHPDKFLITTYEDIVSRKSIKDILEKLEIECPTEYKTLKPDIVKQTINPPNSYFLNYDEMKEYLTSNHSTLMNDPGCPEFP